MEKRQLTAEEQYRKNQRISKGLKIISPIVFWVCIALSILFIILAFKNSFGNVAEITSMLDDKHLTGEELEANYAYLLDKYGEWVIGDGSKGFTIAFVNIGRALFSGVMIASCIFALLFFILAFVLGKWLFPRLADQITENNQDMVNLTILKQQDK